MDKQEIKKALDKFEDEDFVSSKDLLAKELKKKINSYIKDKTQLTKDPVDNVEDDEPDTEETEDEPKEEE